MFTKTIIQKDFGKGFPAFRGSKKVDRLVHSKGVVLDFDHVRYVGLSGMCSLTDDFEVIGVGDIKKQTDEILKIIQNTLAEYGGSMNDIIRVRLYVVDLDDERLRTIHEVRKNYFDPEHYPASTLVGVSKLVMPDLLIEIDADALIKKKSGIVS